MIRWMEYGIREHAVLYGLLAENLCRYAGEETGLSLIEQFTARYGEMRGRRMRKHTQTDQKPADISSFLIYGEWAGKPGENRSSMHYGDKETVSEVTRCAWYDAWREYGLLPYGRNYCRWIDRAICAGYNGEFSLEVKEALGLDGSKCLFCWNQKADQDRIIREKEKNGTRWIRPFSFHCRELLEAFRLTVTDPGLQEAVINETEAEFLRLFPEADFSVIR